MEIPYNPVSSDFRDKLGELVFVKKKCEIIFINEGGRVVTQGRLESIYENEEIEFLELQSGLQIRLDRLVQVDGVLADAYC